MSVGDFGTTRNSKFISYSLWYLILKARTSLMIRSVNSSSKNFFPGQILFPVPNGSTRVDASSDWHQTLLIQSATVLVCIQWRSQSFLLCYRRSCSGTALWTEKIMKISIESGVLQFGIIPQPSSCDLRMSCLLRESGQWQTPQGLFGKLLG